MTAALAALLALQSAASLDATFTDIDPTAWTVESFGQCTAEQDPDMDPSNPQMCIVASHPEIGRYTGIMGSDLDVFAVYRGADLIVTATANRADYCRGQLADDEQTITTVCRF